jgi:hypothetical protein
MHDRAPHKERLRARLLVEVDAAPHGGGNVNHAIDRSEPGTRGRQESRLLQARYSIAVVAAALVLGAAWWAARSYFVIPGSA